MHDADLRRAGAVLEIDLAAIKSNYWSLRRRVRGDCAAVVKADAYGLGATKVAPVLAADGCRQFFVAHLDEAIVLRPVLPAKAEVYVLNGLPPGAEADCATAGVVPVLNSLAQVDAWAALARTQSRTLPAVLQVDSGMSRMGLPDDELAVLAENPRRLDGITVRLVMSHLACAEQQGHAMNREQHARFAAARRRLPSAPASLANSSGIFLGPDFHFDLVRPGAALYGLAPVADTPNPMQPVVRLRARIVQTRDISSGTVVGYGASWRAKGPRRIATVSVGYADGYLRNLSHRAIAHIGETPVALVGIVSMDSAIFDVTGVPQAVAGGFVDLIGPCNSLDAVATAAGTIGYEILTSLGSRYARVYADAPRIERRTA